MLTSPATRSSHLTHVSLAIGLVLFALGTISLLGIVQIELGRKRLAGRYAQGEPCLLPPAPVLRALSFGFAELAADLPKKSGPPPDDTQQLVSLGLWLDWAGRPDAVAMDLL